MKYILIILLFLTQSLFAGADEVGGYAGSFLRMGSSARNEALGNSVASLTGDISTVTENPASAGFLEQRQFASSVQFLSLDRSLSSLIIGFPVPPTAGLSIAWIHAGISDIDGRDFANNPTEKYSTSQDAFYVSFANRFHKNVSAGLTTKILYDQLPEVSATGFGLDVGILVNILPGLNTSFVIKDIKSDMNWNTDKVYDFGGQKIDSYPTLYNASFSYQYKDLLMITGTFKGSKIIQPTSHIGMEVQLNHNLQLRAGLDDTMPVFGLSTRYKAWQNLETRLDYAFIFGKVGEGVSHSFSWLFFF